MKILVLSDIHGSELSLKTVLNNFSDFDLLLICGDFLNHGPRNPLPDGWNPKGVAEILNSLSDKIVCVRGNCDSEVDEMVLTFPCLNAYTNIMVVEPVKATTKFLNGRIFVHHGHLYTKEKLKSWLPKGTLIVSGHTHVTVLEKDDDFIFFNPGSISLPKCDDGKTCGLIETDENGIKSISLCSIEGKILKELEL